MTGDNDPPLTEAFADVELEMEAFIADQWLADPPEPHAPQRHRHRPRKPGRPSAP